MEVEKFGAQSYQVWSKARLAEGRLHLWRQSVMLEFPQSVMFGYPQLNGHPYQRLEMVKQQHLYHSRTVPELLSADKRCSTSSLWETHIILPLVYAL